MDHDYGTNRTPGAQSILPSVDYDCLYSFGMEWEENRPTTYPAGRKCRVCSRPLNSYNPGPNCEAHKTHRRVRIADALELKRTDSPKQQAEALVRWIAKNKPVEADLRLGKVKHYPAKISRAIEMGYGSVSEMYIELYKKHGAVFKIVEEAHVGSYHSIRDYLAKCGIKLQCGARFGNTNGAGKKTDQKKKYKTRTKAEQHLLWVARTKPVEADLCLGIVDKYAKKLQIARGMGYGSINEMLCDLYAKTQSIRAVAGYGIGSYSAITKYLNGAGVERKKGARIGNTNGHRKAE